MTVFTLPKDVDDIEEAVLLPEDFYNCVIVKEPVLKPNKKMEVGLSEEEGAGYNLIIVLKTESDDPEFAGRWFTLYFGWPTLADENKRDMRGSKISDKKMGDIIKFTLAFGGSVEGLDVILSENLRGQGYVLQEIDSRSGTLVNSISPFGEFKAIE